MTYPFKLILASQSPRRKAILAEVIPEFEIRVKDTPEDFSSDLDPFKVPEMLAQRKAAAFLKELKPDEVVLASDTVVILGDTILGKPGSREEARKMLKSLSGNSHFVVTGVCLLSTSKQVVFSERTEVSFMNLSEEDIEYYLEHYKPYDKAGSYGIQEFIGYVGIDRINGSYFTVVGLPVHRVVQELRKF